VASECRFAGRWVKVCGKCEAIFSHRIARVLFSIQDGKILTLHGLIKKSRKTPDEDLALARRRKREFDG
jgi:phage-related protein